jgi:hypothetical protein
MGLIKRAGRLLRLASGVLARACCCDDEGCCVIDGIPAPQHTTKEECEACERQYLCYEGMEAGGSPCPDGWDSFFGVCLRQRLVPSCEDCMPPPPSISLPECSLQSSTGPCGTWQESCPQCIHACYSHPTWTVSETPCVSAFSPIGPTGCESIVGQTTISKPASMAGVAVNVTISGTFDDSIAVNGVPVGPFCRGAGPIFTAFSMSAGTSDFVLGAVDSFGVSCSGSLAVCFTPVNPLP